MCGLVLHELVPRTHARTHGLRCADTRTHARKRAHIAHSLLLAGIVASSTLVVPNCVACNILIRRKRVDMVLASMLHWGRRSVWWACVGAWVCCRCVFKRCNVFAWHTQAQAKVENLRLKVASHSKTSSLSTRVSCTKVCVPAHGPACLHTVLRA